MAMAWVRHEGRQALGRMMHGPDVLIGIPATDLTTTSMGVAKLSVYEDDYFNDWHGRFYKGPLADTDFEATDFDQQTEPGLKDGVITLKPTMAQAIVAHDLFEMYPEYSPAEMNDAINLAISMVENEALQDKVDESLVVASSQFEYAIPSGFVYIEDIVQETTTPDRYSVSLNRIDSRYWGILPGATPSFWFDSNWVSLTAGRKLRLIGQGAPPLLKADDDMCSVSQAYVLYQAKANLHFARVAESGDEHDKKMVIAQTRADRERQRITVAGRGAKAAF